MGKCLSKQTKKIILVMVGLDNAGKTTTAKGIVGDSPVDVAPTLGFSSFHLRHQNYDVTIYDVGGNKSIRGIWRNYLAEAFGFIFVIDASDSLRAEECREVLHALLKNPVVSGKPFLILANKQDVENALDEVEICGLLQIEPVVNEVKSRTRVETCSAINISSKKPDRGIQTGFRWLLATIGMDFANLQLKVEQDVAIQREVEAKEKLEREERIKKLREERDKQVANDGLNNEMPDDHVIKENPFRPVNIVVKALHDKESQNGDSSPHLNGVMKLPKVQNENLPDSWTIKKQPTFGGLLGNERQRSSDSSKSACELIHDMPFNDKNVEKPSHLMQLANESTMPPGTVITPEQHELQEKPLISRQSTINEDNESYIFGSQSPLQTPQKNQNVELERTTKSRKKKLFARNNKTAPKPEAFGELPPLVIKSGIKSDNSVPWIKAALPSLSNSQADAAESDSDVNVNWSLAEELGD